MNDHPPRPTQRVSAIPFPERYALPGKPADASPQVQDAYRQTSFVLGDDLRLLEEGLQLQLRIVQDSSHSSFRKHPYAALIGLWSRTFVALVDGCLLTTRGAYGSTAPLVRAACEFIAAQHQLHTSEMEQYLEWLAAGFGTNDEHKAVEFGLGRYFAGEVLAADERLRAVYRPASELARPSFGPTTLLIGPESNHQRLALTFGDAAFHVGWAEIALGWLLALCERQLAVAVHARDVFSVSDDTHEAYADLSRRTSAVLERSDRAAIEEVTDEGKYRRYLVHNFRRAPGGAPKKFLL